tara:strand:- start:30464 stop:30643 length:180 start_codon:yes stop_codon:yes gene_type:complete
LILRQFFTSQVALSLSHLKRIEEFARFALDCAQIYCRVFRAMGAEYYRLRVALVICVAL